jgi:hypothetical protein
MGSVGGKYQDTVVVLFLDFNFNFCLMILTQFFAIFALDFEFC